MPALNFQKKFVPMILDGSKCQTIRRERKNFIKVGDKLFLNTGMRTRGCRRIKEAICTEIQYIQFVNWFGDQKVLVDNHILLFSEMEELAKADGFESFSDFLHFFERQYGPDFEGVIIHWD